MQPIYQEIGGRLARWPWIFAAIILAGGIAATTYVYRLAVAAERRAAEDDFRAQANAFGQRISREVEMFEDVLASLSRLHTLSDRISREDFEEFVEKGLQFHQRVLGTFGFAQQIDEGTRALLETAESNALRIVQRDPQDPKRLVGASRREAYFPLTYQYPEGGLALPLGFDFGSESNYIEAIHKLYAGAAPVWVGKAPGTEENDSYLVFAPILYIWASEEEGRAMARALIGFTIGQFVPSRIVARALQGYEEVIQRGGWLVEWGGVGGAGDRVAAEGEKRRIRRDFTVSIAGALWRLRISADADAFLPVGRRRSAAIFLMGLAMTGLVTLEVLLMAGRGRRVEKLVRERTAALRKAKEQLEREMQRRMKLEEEILNVVTREKTRVGRDLHDSLGQKLTGAVLMSRALAARTMAALPECREDAERVHELLKEAVAQVRRIARGLAPVDLGERGLVGALEQLAEDIRESGAGVECHLSLPEKIPGVNGSVAQHLYHIAQEAVTNALRHSKARHVSVELRASEEAVELVVADDGKGFDAAQAKGGLGLEIMRYRADLIGGSLDVSSSSSGTTVCCLIPHSGGDGAKK